MHALRDFVERFRGAFTAPTFTNFAFIALSWIWTGSTGTITSLLRASTPLPADLDQDVRAKHHSVLHRFFTRASWSPDELGHRVFRMLASRLSVVVLLAVDDTLCRRTGLNVVGASGFVDPLRKDHKSGRKVFSFGVNFVVLSVWVDLPWMSGGGTMVPILWRLYRSKKTCPARLYKKQTELAVEMLHIVAGWLDARRKVRVVADSAYICGPVGNRLPDNFALIGPLKVNSVLRSAQLAPYKGRGRRPKWGQRLGPITKLCQQRCTTTRHPYIYERHIKMCVASLEAVWEPLGTRVLRVVLTLDPAGNYEPRAFISTCLDDGIEQVLRWYARRWRLELVFREAKQLLGMEKVCNGFCHVPGRAARPKGAQAPQSKVPVATARTAPFALLCYGLVIAWFAQHGAPEATLRWARLAAPWYTTKRTLSFADMLAAMRQAMREEFHGTPSPSLSPETHHGASQPTLTTCGQQDSHRASQVVADDPGALDGPASTRARPIGAAA